MLHIVVDDVIGRHGNWHAWGFIAAVLVTGFAAIIALTRIGLRLFWSVAGRTTPRLRVIEVAPIAFLIVLCLALAAGRRAGDDVPRLRSAIAAFARGLHPRRARRRRERGGAMKLPVVLTTTLVVIWLLLAG